MAGARGPASLDTAVLAPTNIAPGSYTAPPPPTNWYAVPPGTGHIEVTMNIPDDARLTTPGLHLDMAMDGTDDPAAATPFVQNIAAATWDSGPGNQPRTPGNPLPRPGTGWTTLPSWCTAVRGRLTVVLGDGTRTVYLGVDVTTGP